MPLPNDEQLIELADRLLSHLISAAGSHPGFRPAHARGLLVKGDFTPTAAAGRLTKAPHFHRDSTPVVVRLSNATGLPALSDTDPKANPHGMAIRFYLAERVHTDIIGHSVDSFPTRTGDQFLEMLRALGNPETAAKFLSEHPAAARFVQTPKPSPQSYATEKLLGVTSVEFENVDGIKRFARYRILPEIPTAYLEEGDLRAKSESYLHDELKQRVEAIPIAFKLFAQMADEGDVVDDATVRWPEDRELVELGRIELRELVPDDAAEQKHLIFDPIPRVEGIEPSADPLLELRAAVYLLSGRMRRSA